MMRSLYSGVSGLKVHQTKMDVIGNNISNVNTIGFKSSQVNFSDILYQTSSDATGPNAEARTAGINAKKIGLGASVSSISTITTSGGSQRTDNALDIMIEGNQFFIVDKTARITLQKPVILLSMQADFFVIQADARLWDGFPTPMILQSVFMTV